MVANNSFVIPITTKKDKISEFGCGVFVGNYFITAGHVLEGAETSTIKIDEKKLTLEKPIILLNNGSSNGYYLAIYYITGFDNSNRLSVKLPSPKTQLISTSYRVIDQGIEYISCEAYTNDIIEGNYFGLETKELIKEGSSGSPVWYNNEIVGIIVRGNMENGKVINKELSPNFCMALSSKSIIEVLRQNKLV